MGIHLEHLREGGESDAVKPFFLSKMLKSLLLFALLAGSFVTLTAKNVEESDIENVNGDGTIAGDDSVLDRPLLWRKTRDLNKQKKQKNKSKSKDKKDKAERRNENKGKGKLKKNKKEGKGTNNSNKGNSKAKKKDKKEQNKSKKKKRNKNKKRKKLTSDDDLRSKRNTTCTTETVASTCLDNAMVALSYEKNQVSNYLKQAARLKGHKNIKEKKLFKQGEFMAAADHLIFAVGGNMSNPKCADPDDNSTEALATKEKEFEYILSNYTLLQNCSNAITEACTLSNETFNDSHQDELDVCNQTKWTFILDSRKCHKLQAKSTNATEICECWNKAAEDVETIKAQNCETKKKQVAITKQKNFCKKVFKNCKDMEDHSIHLTWHCMHDHSMHLLNQTSKTIHEGIIKDAKALTGEEKLLDFSYFDYK